MEAACARINAPRAQTADRPRRNGVTGVAAAVAVIKRNLLAAAGLMQQRQRQRQQQRQQQQRQQQQQQDARGLSGQRARGKLEGSR